MSLENRLWFRLALIAFALSFLPFICWGGTRLIAAILFSKDCTGHLKRAADASTIALAEKELSASLAYLDNHEMTSGYTAILWRTPYTDVGFWYDNLTSARDELVGISNEATQLERTNVLMKLRESLLDDSGSGVSVTMPGGISIFPYNGLFCFWCWASVILIIVFLIPLIYLDKCSP